MYDCTTLRAIVLAVDCPGVCVPLRSVHGRATAFCSGKRCCARVVGGGGGREQSMLRTSATQVPCMSQSLCATAVVREPTATATECCECCVCGVVALDAAACGCGRVCTAAPPLCTTVPC